MAVKPGQVRRGPFGVGTVELEQRLMVRTEGGVLLGPYTPAKIVEAWPTECETSTRNAALEELVAQQERNLGDLGPVVEMLGTSFQADRREGETVASVLVRLLGELSVRRRPS